MSDRSLHWLACDAPGCSNESRELARSDDADADHAAAQAGWGHYVADHGSDEEIMDVCPTCLATRSDLAALCAIEMVNGY